MIDPPPDFDWDDIPRTKKVKTRGRFQYSLQSLLLFVTGVAVFCSLCAWLGLFPWILFCGAVGAIIGMIIGLRFGFDTQIDHLPWEFVRCLFASFILLAPNWYVITIVPDNNRIIIPILIIVGFLFKTIWRNFCFFEIAWVEISMINAMLIGGGIGVAVVGT